MTRISAQLNIYALRAVQLLSAIFLGFIIIALITGFLRSDLIAPAQTLLLLDRDQKFLAELSDQPQRGHGYWTLTHWPERVANALIALEDKRFWSHPGVDLGAMARAIYQNAKHGRRISGASTIAMQIARMQNPKQRTYFNKCIESATALMITLRHTRQEIMLHYLKIVPYGNQIHGIGYAAERYFNKPADDLSWAEIALLSAIPQSPTHNNPLKVSGRIRAEKRARRSLQQLYSRNQISSEQLQLANLQLNNLVFPRPSSRPTTALHSIFKLKSLLHNNLSLQAASPRIETTLSLSLQSKVTQLSNDYLNTWQDAGVDNISAIVLEKKSNNVLAWLGSPDYFKQQAGAIDFAQTYRSPGSTLKPFIFALGLDRGVINPSTVMADVQSLARGTKNSDNLFLGPLLPRQALANSRNIPASNLVRQIGINETYLFLQSLGIHEGLVSSRHYGSGMAIGTLPTSLERLVRAYSSLANDGVSRELHWYDGQHTKPSQRVMSQNVSRLITLFLSDPMARLPSFPRMGTTEYPFPVAAKTGTSQGFRDAWTIAYSTEYIVGVWVGRSDAKPMHELGGAASAALLTQSILLHLHKNTQKFQNNIPFPVPADYQLLSLCALTGKKATQLCPQRYAEWLPKNHEVEVDTSFQELIVDRRNGLLAGQWTPKIFRQKKLFLDLPFIYRRWAKTAGYGLLPSAFSPLDGNAKTLATSLSMNEHQTPSIDIRIISPDNPLQVQKIPDTPTQHAKIAINVDISSNGANKLDQLLWYVDGKAYQLEESPFTLRWPLKAGTHTFYAEAPYYGSRSNTLTVNVYE